VGAPVAPFEPYDEPVWIALDKSRNTQIAPCEWCALQGLPLMALTARKWPIVAQGWDEQP
jgi:hypothetical protein